MYVMMLTHDRGEWISTTGAGDFDGDGDQDVAAGGQSSPLVVVDNDLDGPSGAFAKRADPISAVSGVIAVAVLDANNDTTPDLAFVSSSGQRVGVYLGLGSFVGVVVVVMVIVGVVAVVLFELVGFALPRLARHDLTR